MSEFGRKTTAVTAATLIGLGACAAPLSGADISKAPLKDQFGYFFAGDSLPGFEADGALNRCLEDTVFNTKAGGGELVTATRDDATRVITVTALAGGVLKFVENPDAAKPWMAADTATQQLLIDEGCPDPGLNTGEPAPSPTA